MSGIVHWEDNGIRSIECSHCHAHFSFDGYKLANFLYGLILLNGKKVGYLGTTCPSCLNTILSKIDRPKFDLYAAQLRKGIFSDSFPVYNQLYYYPSVNYAPHKIKGLSAFQIPPPQYVVVRKENQELAINNLDEFRDAGFELGGEDEYLCSYLPANQPPIGYIIAVCFFKEDQIHKLEVFENKHNIKVFPRYFHKMDVLNQIDEFCWKYGLYMKFRAERKINAEKSFEALRESAEFEGVEVGEIAVQRLGIDPEEIEFMAKMNGYENDTGALKIKLAESGLGSIEMVEEDAIEKPSEWDIVKDFIEILLADPDPFPADVNANALLKQFQKRKFPFHKQSVPETISSLRIPEDDFNKGIFEHDQMVADLRELSHLKATREFLKREVLNFVNAYVDKFKSSTYSYADFWELKFEYLKALHETVMRAKETDEIVVVQSELLPENQRYFFLKEGRAYRIIFEGKTFDKLTELGFHYLYYIVKNKGKSHTPVFLYDRFQSDPHKQKPAKNFDIGMPQVYKDEEHERHDFDGIAQRTQLVSPGYKQGLRDIKKKIDQLKGDLVKAEAEGKSDEAKRVQEEIDRIEDHKRKYIQINSDDKKDPLYESKRKAVGNAFTRAMKILNNKDVERHFRRSITGFSSSSICYQPDPDIDWFVS